MAAQEYMKSKAGLTQQLDTATGRKRCWELLNCSPEARAACAAPQRPDIPCWVARQIAGQPLPIGCGTCQMRALRDALGVA